MSETTLTNSGVASLTPPRRAASPWQHDLRQFLRNPLATWGAVVLILFVLIAIFAPMVAQFPKGYGKVSDLVKPPSSLHWFGTDEMGLDIFAQVIWGTRVTMLVALMAACLAVLIGVPIGLASAFYKGNVDAVLTGLTDIFLSLPSLPLMILMAAVLGPSLFNLALVIGLLSWPQVARVVRGVTMSTMGMPFVEAAVSIGSSSLRILSRHLFPNAVPVLVVNVLLITSRAVLSEAGLSFLGLGDPLQWSWGRILQNAQRNGAFVTAWWMALFPSIAILLLIIATTFVGTAINEISNPRLKRR